MDETELHLRIESRITEVETTLSNDYFVVRPVSTASQDYTVTSTYEGVYAIA